MPVGGMDALRSENTARLYVLELSLEAETPKLSSGLFHPAVHQLYGCFGTGSKLGEIVPQ